MQLIDWVYLGIFGVMLFSTNLWLAVYLFNRKEVHTDPELERYPSVSFLVPAYNEESYIEECIESLLNLDYPQDKISIIAINDGSEDSTLEKMRKYSDKIQIIDKENSGKSSSMNKALEHVDTELVASMDADSRPEKDYLRNVVSYFQEEGVQGVTPTMKIEDPETWAQRAIWMEYIYNLLLRKLFSVINGQFVMPGPGSVYKTDHIKEIGGWDEETLTEDMEVVFRMIENGAEIRNSANAFVRTHSPATFKGLFRQRSRWYRGNLNNAIRYRDFFFNPAYGNFGVLILPFNLIWAVLVMFLLGHFSIRIASSIGEFAFDMYSYGVILSLPTFSIQNLSLFHLFNISLAVFGISMIYLSMKLSEEGFKTISRKVDISIFMLFYAFLYSAFWIKALADKFGGVKSW